MLTDRHIAGKVRAAAEQYGCSTYIAASPEQRHNRARSSHSNTSCTPEAAPGTTVGEREPGGAREGRA